MIIIIMGVSGSGKTAVGRELARATSSPFFDADDFHPPRSIEKMRRGEPLTEDDRAPWLDQLSELVEEWAESSELAVLACSALTRESRRRLKAGADGVKLVFLHGPAALIEARMHGRRHFMPPGLLSSQLAALEPPDDALEIDVRDSAEGIVARIRAALDI